MLLLVLLHRRLVLLLRFALFPGERPPTPPPPPPPPPEPPEGCRGVVLVLGAEGAEGPEVPPQATPERAAAITVRRQQLQASLLLLIPPYSRQSSDRKFRSKQTESFHRNLFYIGKLIFCFTFVVAQALITMTMKANHASTGRSAHQGRYCTPSTHCIFDFSFRFGLHECIGLIVFPYLSQGRGSEARIGTLNKVLMRNISQLML